MEKISHIVRGNARVASVDLKGAPSVRPGALSFGRSIGESPPTTERGESTAARATAIQTEMNDVKKITSNDRIVQNMADQFFMTRIRRPEEEPAPVSTKARASAEEEEEPEIHEQMHTGQTEQAESGQPSGFTPRGSYVNVRA